MYVAPGVTCWKMCHLFNYKIVVPSIPIGFTIVPPRNLIFSIIFGGGMCRKSVCRPGLTYWDVVWVYCEHMICQCFAWLYLCGKMLSSFSVHEIVFLGFFLPTFDCLLRLSVNQSFAQLTFAFVRYSKLRMLAVWIFSMYTVHQYQPKEAMGIILIFLTITLVQ